MSFSSHWELLLGVNVITRVPVGCFTPRCTASAAADEPSCLSAWICPYSSRVGIVAGVRAELCMPVCAFLAPFGSRVVAFPGHFWSVHRTLTDLSLCLHYQHGLKQVFFLQDVRVRRVSKLLYTACCNSLPPPPRFFKKKLFIFLGCTELPVVLIRVSYFRGLKYSTLAKWCLSISYGFSPPGPTTDFAGASDPFVPCWIPDSLTSQPSLYVILKF